MSSVQVSTSTSAASVPAIAVARVTSQFSVSPWRSVSWRLYRQLLPVAIFAIAVVGLLQLICLSAITWIEGLPWTKQVYQETLHKALFYSSLIYALGWLAVSFGVDREQRTWHWRSAFPVSWKAEVVTHLSALIVGVILCLVANSLPILLSYWVGPSQLSDPSVYLPLHFRSFFYPIIPLLPLLLVVQLYCESVGKGLAIGVLSAFAVETVRVTTGQALDWPDIWWSLTRWGMTLSFSAWALVVWHRRWRTGLYQQSQLFVRQPAAHRALQLTSSPTGWWSQALLSLRTQFWPIAAVMSFGLLYLGYLLWSDWRPGETLLFFLSISSIAYGAGVFGSEHGQRTLAFFSDRGVSATTLWTARVVPNLLILSCVFVTVAAVEFRYPAPEWMPKENIVGQFLVAWGLAVLSLQAGSASRGWLTAFGGGILMLIPTLLLWEMQFYAGGVGGMGLAILVSVALMLTVSWFSTRTVVQRGQAIAWRANLTTLGLLLVANLLMYPVLRVMSIRSVSQLPFQVSLPEIGSQKEKQSSLLPLEDLQAMVTLLPSLKAALQLSEPNKTIYPNNPGEVTRLSQREYVLSEEEQLSVRHELPADVNTVLRQLRQKLDQWAVDGTPELEIRELSQTVSLQKTLTHWVNQMLIVSAALRDQELAEDALEASYRLYRQNLEAGISLIKFHPDDTFTELSSIPDTDWRWLIETFGREAVDPPTIPWDEIKQFAAQVRQHEVLSGGNGKPAGIDQLEARLRQGLAGDGWLVGVAKVFLTEDLWEQLPWERMRRQRIADYEYARTVGLIEDHSLTTDEFFRVYNLDIPGRHYVDFWQPRWNAYDQIYGDEGFVQNVFGSLRTRQALIERLDKLEAKIKAGIPEPERPHPIGSPLYKDEAAVQRMQAMKEYAMQMRPKPRNQRESNQKPLPQDKQGAGQ